ncbi:MAG: SMC family ATPase, partial [Chloroflexota bacterium]
MIPIKLSLSGFLSYRDAVELDFTGFDLACISGANGAGKSSLLDGITWALFGQARKRDDSIINTQSDVAEVYFVFSYEQDVYRVQRIKARDKATILEFHVQAGDDSWKALTERTLRDTEARIREILRLDYETFVNAAFFLQGKADQFTQQRPGDRKRILSSILGLEIWETYRKAASERQKEKGREIDSLDGRLDEISTELGEEKDRKARLAELKKTLNTLSKARAVQESVVEQMQRSSVAFSEQEKLVATLKGQLEKRSQELSALEEKLAEREKENKGFEVVIGQEKQITAEFEEWQNLKEKLVAWDKTAERFREQESRRHAPLGEIDTARALLKSNIEALKKEEAGIDAKRKEIESIETRLAAIMQELEQVEIKMAKKAELDAELSEAMLRQTEAKTENPILKEEMDRIKARMDQLEQTKEPDCPLCSQPLTPEHRADVISQLSEQGADMGNRYRDNQSVLIKADETIGKLQQEVGLLSELDEELRHHRRGLDLNQDQIKRLQSEIEGWETDGNKQLLVLSAQYENEEFALDAKKILAEVDLELKAIGYDASSHDSAKHEEIEKSVIEIELRKLGHARAAAAPLEREIQDIRAQVSSLQVEQEAQQKIYDEAAAAFAASQMDAPDLEKAKRELLVLQEDENKARREEGAAEQMVAVLKDLEKRKVDLEHQREEMALQLGKFQQLERAFSKDGVPAMLIEQALPQIETKANEILERLSGGTMYIRFITQQEYKDKNRADLKETLEIQISDNAGVRDYEMYSGGEAFRINFAIRLALSEVLAQRAGARLQTLVIDE